jgi:hypothetical protein
VLVYPDGGLLKLFEEVPDVEQIIRSAVESRLAAR